MYLRSRDDLEDWLREQSRRTILTVSIRSTLRLLRFLSVEKQKSYDVENFIWLQSFRAAAISWHIVNAQKYIGFIKGAAHAGDEASIIARVYEQRKSMPYYVAQSASYSAKAVSLTNKDDAIGSCISAVDSEMTLLSRIRPDANFSDLAGDLCEDLNFCRNSDLAGKLINAPLFFEKDIAVEWKGVRFGDWELLKEELLANHENWGIWINWYDDRLKGRDANRIAAFGRALNAMTELEWRRHPKEVNARLMYLLELEGGNQKPAISVFDVVKGKIEGSLYPIDRTEYGEIASDIHFELKRQLEKYAARLHRFDDHPTTSEVLDDIVQISAALGSSIDEAKPGRLSQQLEFLKVASARLQSVVDQQVLPVDLIDVLPALEKALRRFLGLYDDELRLIDARAEALGIRAQDFHAVEQRLDAVIRIAENSILVSRSAVVALRAGFSEKGRLTDAIDKLSGVTDGVHAELIMRRALEQGREIRNQENFVSCVRVAADNEDKNDESLSHRLEGAIKDGMADAVQTTASEAGKTGLALTFKALFAAIRSAVGG